MLNNHEETFPITISTEGDTPPHVVNPPEYGTVTITYQDGKPMYVNVENKTKLN